MAKLVISSHEIFQKLHDAKLINTDPRNVRRCLIDLKVNEPAHIYVETFVDEKLIDVMLGLRVTKPPQDP